MRDQPPVRDLVHRFAWLTALRWFPIGLYVPIAVLLMQARGLDLATIGGVYAIYGVVTVALELPTGGLADAVGRRAVLVAASIATATGLALGAVAQDAGGFALMMVVGAVGRALGSGPLEAWFVDAVAGAEPGARAGSTPDGVAGTGPEAVVAGDAAGTVRAGLSRAAGAEALALGIGSIAGGMLPGITSALVPTLASSGHALLITLSIPVLAGAIGMLGHGLAVVILVREASQPAAATARPGMAGRAGLAQSAATLLRDVPSTVRRGVQLGIGDRVLRRLLLRAALLGVVLSGVELLAPGTFAGLLGGEQEASGAYGLLGAMAFGASAAGAWLAPLGAARLGGASRTAAVMSGLAAPAAVVVAAPFLALAGLGYVAIYLMLGVVGPLTSELLHGRVASGERATMVSVESLALQAGGVVANLGLGALAVATSPALGFGVVGAALIASALLLISVRSGEPDTGRMRTAASTTAG
jgi:hypothetical protein